MTINPALILERKAKERSEFMRWVLLLASNLSRPAPTALDTLKLVVRSEFPDATEMEIRRELDYLESRELLKVMVTTMGQVAVDLTRAGIDVAEYTVPVDPGIARPPKV